MTTISIDRRWTNSACQEFDLASSLQFGSASSIYKGREYSSLQDDGASSVSFLRGMKTISTAALSVGMLVICNPSYAASATSVDLRPHAIRQALATRSEERRQKLEALATEMRSFLQSAHLEGREARDTLDLALRDALGFIQIIPSDIELPFAAHTVDGEIILLWDDGDKRAEMEFLGADQLGYAMRHHNRFVAGQEDGKPSSFPQDLLAYLR